MVGEAVTDLSKTVAKKKFQNTLLLCKVCSKPCVNTVSNIGKQTRVFYPLLKGHKTSTGNLEMKIHKTIT